MRNPKKPGRAAAALRARPDRTYVTGSVTRAIRWITLGIGVCTVVAVLWGYPSLPDEIPTHFNVLGEADSWGSKSSLFVFVLVAIVIIGGMAWLSHHPRIFNYPTEITEENAQGAYRTGEQLLVWCNAACALIFAAIATMMLTETNLSWAIVIGLVSLFASLIAALVRLLRV